MNPTLGKRAKDRITGFEGVVTGHAKHLTGCDTVCITPTIDSDGRLRQAEWFDIDRVEEGDSFAPCGFAPEIESK